MAFVFPSSTTLFRKPVLGNEVVYCICEVQKKFTADDYTKLLGLCENEEKVTSQAGREKTPPNDEAIPEHTSGTYTCFEEKPIFFRENHHSPGVVIESWLEGLGSMKDVGDGTLLDSLSPGYSWLSGCERTLSVHVQLFIHQHPQVLLCRAALNPFIPKPVLILRVTPTQVQDLALGVVEPHEVPLDGIPSLQCIDHTTQLGVVCRLAEGALDPTVYVIDEDIKQYWSL
ncbi:hypothetical protein QYF61_011451 [Mycteria americana]|uniref:Uncharacterized protein n=1 Tax=Mycteria americana TaxID=33587 RepID=A0AAN7N263_MYCAM|nr:hypothetical protein QYF61_011451 [Mycteria americana]